MVRLLKSVVGSAIAISLLAGSVAGAAAQDASPEPTASNPPATIASPAPQEAEAAVEPLPVADYWGEWDLHKRAYLDRVRGAVDAANRAKQTKLGFYRALVGVYGDELQWLANHRPDDCYADEFEQWRATVMDLRAIGKEAVASVRKGDTSRAKRAAKRRRAATKDLESVLSSVADCVDSEPLVMSENPFVGAWTARPVEVAADGARDTSVRRLTIGEGGGLLLRIPRNAFCRTSGLGAATLTVRGTGEVVVDDTPEFHWVRDRIDCRPRGKRPVVLARNGPGGIVDYGATADVLLLGAECYWRTKGGSPKDCQTFWRGTPPKSEDTEASVEEGAAPEDEATATLDGSGG